MKKVGILTFHASHNYGSMLQAYALKKYVCDHGAECEIVNYRTEKQKDIYAVLTKRKGLRYILKNFYVLMHYRKHKDKYELFEKFLSDTLGCGAELSDEDMSKLSYDVVVTGSDQIWNIEANDFSDIYFGKGVNCDKIAYAVSCGNGDFANETAFRKYAEYIRAYRAISVRDSATAKLVETTVGQAPMQVCDPVMLLDSGVWATLAAKPKTALPKKYIFLYTLSCTKELADTAKKLSDSLGLPIVISKVTSPHDILMKAKKVFDCGPAEFLYLMQNAECVLTTSFHAMLFSMILSKHFFAVGSTNDNRQKVLLKHFGIEKNIVDSSISDEEIVSVMNADVDFSSKIEEFSRSGKAFLEENLL